MSVRNALLGLLAERPRHGYELRAAFEAMMGGEANWDLSPAQVYTTLGRLDEAGLVEPRSVEKAGGPEKRIYGLTSSGRRELQGWLATASEPGPQRDEFFLKLMIALATGEARPRSLIQRQRAVLFRILHQVTARREQTDAGTHLAHILLLDKVVMQLEADLRWLDMIEARLDDVRRQPLPQPVSPPRGRPRRQLASRRPAISPKKG